MMFFFSEDMLACNVGFTNLSVVSRDKGFVLEDVHSVKQLKSQHFKTRIISLIIGTQFSQLLVRCIPRRG